MAELLIDAAMKAMQWERCKGELRALVALQGSYESNDYACRKEGLPTTGDHWRHCGKIVEDFIIQATHKGLAD